MTTEKNKNLEIVSSKEQVKSKKDQMLEKIKLDMIEDLKIDEKLIKRNTFAKEIEKARGNAVFPEEVEFWGKIIKIEEKKGPYKALVAKYKDIDAGTISFDGLSKEDMIKEIDKELAEQIILNKNKMIEFSSTEIEKEKLEDEAKKSFERLEKNKKYQKKIELIKKTNGEETLFVIKRTKKQLEEIARIEKAYDESHSNEEVEVVTTEEKKEWEELRKLKKELESMKIGETTEITMPNGKSIRIQKKDDKWRICIHNEVEEFNKYIDKNHYVVENGNKSYISYVTNEDLWEFLEIPEDDEPIPPAIEEQELLEATISDTTKITRAIAEREAGEKLRKIFKKTARYKPRSWPTQLTLFLWRGFIKDHYTRKYMKMKGGMQRDKSLTKGTDRHEMEFENKFNDDITSVGTIDENTYPETYKEIIIIGEQLEQGTITPVDFQKDFKDIIEDPTLDTSATPKLTDLIKQNDIQQMSSNITEKIRAFADHKKLVAGIIGHMGEPNDNVFDNKCRTDIAKYFKDHKLQPKFLKDMGLKLDDPNTIKDLRNNISHRATLKQIAAKTMKLKIQILTKGEEAYDVKQELSWFRWAMTKAGDRLDKPVSDKSRFGKRLERNPFAKGAFGTLRGITKLGVMITPALLLAPLWPLAIASWAGGMTFIKTLLKRHSHYNKEHIGYQRNQANNLLTNRAERTRLLNEMNKMGSWEKFFRYYFGIGKKSKEVRQFRDYLKTTHDQLENSKDMIQKMETLLHKEKLTNTEPDQLERLIAQWLARIDHHKTTGQNFLGSENEATSEEEYQTIHRLVLTGAMRLDKDLATDLRTTRAYKRELNTLNHGNGGNEINEIGYEKARKRFKNRQTEKALIGAVRAWGIAFGLSYLASTLASSKWSTETLSDNTWVKENFTLGGHESAGSNWVYNPAKTFFDTPNASGQTISFDYGWWTDATSVIPGNFTPAEYSTKLLDVKREIIGMHISVRAKANLIHELNTQPWLGVTGQENAVLHNMRCVEGIEQVAKALEDSSNAWNIVISPHYAPSVHNITASTRDSSAERVVQGTLDYSKEIVTEPVNRAIPVVARKNTFQEPMKGEQEPWYENEETPIREDNPGRKTRTPAPKVTKQPRKTRTRSGESINETQFTK